MQACESMLLPDTARPCVGKIPNALADVDRKCLTAERPDHLTRSVPQSQLQKTAAVLFQDVALFHTPWTFNVSAIRPDIRRATHIWQVTRTSARLMQCCLRVRVNRTRPG